MTDQMTGARVSIEFSPRNADKDVFREVDLRAKVRMSRDATLGYRDACYGVWLEDPELHRAYVTAVPPLRMARGGA